MIDVENSKRWDWRDSESYAYMSTLSRRDWSWEGVRRNPKFVDVWRYAAAAFESRTDGSVTTVRSSYPQTELDRWGIVFCDSPDFNATKATIIWRPDWHSGCLCLSAFVDENPGKKSFSLLNAGRPVALVLRPKDRQHAVFSGSGRGLQLFVQGADLLGSVRLTVDAVTGSEVERAQLSLLRCFHDLVRVGRFKPCLHLRTIESRRLQTVLRAFDGVSAGASHREIATVLYGSARIATDWDDPGEHLKDHIRKTIRRGFEIVHGGYRSFLR